MEGVRAFLDSSTIHGLSYISNTRRLIRLFWILIVIAGFTGAGVLIYQSFEDWSDNPVTTTIETLPIKDATFPKITVCPPKNTFTDLNYDLMTVGNRTLYVNISDKDSDFNVLKKKYVEHFQMEEFDDVYSSLSTFKEKDKYRNWYTGVTKVPIVVDQYGFLASDVIETYATSGEISTPLFGEEFEIEKFKLNAIFKISFNNPYIMDDNLGSGNITLEFTYDIDEINDIIGLTYMDKFNAFGGVMCGGGTLNSAGKEYKVTKSHLVGCDVVYRRSNPELYFADLGKKRFTGLNVKWKYCCNANVTSKKSYKDYIYNQFFIKMVNLVYGSSTSKDDIMKLAIQTKVEYDELTHKQDDFASMFMKMGKQLNESIYNKSEPLYLHEIGDEELVTAAEIFIYILSSKSMSETHYGWTTAEPEWKKFYTDTYVLWLQSCSLRKLLGK